MVAVGTDFLNSGYSQVHLEDPGTKTRDNPQEMRVEPQNLGCPASPSDSVCLFLEINLLQHSLWREIGMETHQQNKPIMESEVPKANSIDSLRTAENGHIWDKLECFAFFNLSSPHPQASALHLNVTRFVLHGLYQIYSWKHKPNFAPKQHSAVCLESRVASH